MKNIHFIIIYDIIWGFGFILLSIILFTAILSTRVKRTPLWIMEVAGWVSYSFSMLILLGNQQDKSPPHALCFAQAAMIYSTPVFSACIAVAYLFQTYWQILRILLPNSAESRRSFVFWFYITPVVPAVAILLTAVATGLKHPEKVQIDPTHMYCHLAIKLFPDLTSSLIVVAMVAVCISEGLILRLILGPNGTPLVSRSVVIRMACFTIWALVIVSVSALDYFPTAFSGKNTDSMVEIIIGTLPCIAALTFGTTSDFLDVWFCRRTNFSVETVPENLTDQACISNERTSSSSALGHI